jgi:hypothetical protein
MKRLTLAYSNHRPETIDLTAPLMKEHEVIVLEEPAHPDFHLMLAGKIDIEDFLLEIDHGYPEFAHRQYSFLRELSRDGKDIRQIEPFLEGLFEIHSFFVDHKPEEIDKTSVHYEIYCTERKLTGLLIDYYRSARGGDFGQIILGMKAFAKADAARLRLRDALRAERLISDLRNAGKVYVEAGSIHLLLERFLRDGLHSDWVVETHHIERSVRRYLGLPGDPYSPGDELTARYMFQNEIDTGYEDLLCAQALIYAKLIQKEEIPGAAGEFPHTRNEYETSQLVRGLPFETCQRLFFQLRPLSTAEARKILMELDPTADGGPPSEDDSPRPH